jgi:hypothetical protein
MPDIAKHGHIEIHPALLQMNNQGGWNSDMIIFEVLATDMRQREKSSLGCQAEP